MRGLRKKKRMMIVRRMMSEGVDILGLYICTNALIGVELAKYLECF